MVVTTDTVAMMIKSVAKGIVVTLTASFVVAAHALTTMSAVLMTPVLIPYVKIVIRSAVLHLSAVTGRVM